MTNSLKSSETSNNDTCGALSFSSQIEAAEEKLLTLPQIDCPLIHKFSPGVYLREIFMPAGSFIIGQQHKTEHFNVVLSGSARMLVDGKVKTVTGPCSFVSGIGVRKLLFIMEDMRWATVHPTTETDIQKLEDELITKSEAFLKYEDIKKLTEGII